MRKANSMACLLTAAALLLAASGPAKAATLTVAVAANAQYAFAELAAAFEARSGHRIKPIYNSSGKLTAQILQGAPFDLFLAADMAYPERVHQAGRALEAPRPYAYGLLVLWTTRMTDLSDWRTRLASASVNRLAIANPRLAPYGAATLEALAHLGLDAALRPKLVYGESISQVNQYIHSGLVDAGFTAKSAVLAPPMRGHGKWVELPPDSYRPIAQGMVLLKQSTNAQRDAARAMYDFLLSREAGTILTRYGYRLP